MVGRIDKEIGVFKIAKKPQIQQDIQHQEELALFAMVIQQQSEQPVQCNGYQEQHNIARLAPGVEQKAGNQKKNVLILRFPDQKAQYEYNRQKDPQKHH